MNAPGVLKFRILVYLIQAGSQQAIGEGRWHQLTKALKIEN
jgi:hypothetical protein